MNYVISDQSEEMDDDEIGHPMDDLELNYSDINLNSSSEDSDSDDKIQNI
jgi:type VI protein secretion system component Hcp